MQYDEFIPMKEEVEVERFLDHYKTNQCIFEVRFSLHNKEIPVDRSDDKTSPVRSSSALPSHVKASRVPLDTLRDSDDVHPVRYS